MKYRVLELLKEAEDYISGEDISDNFDVSRAYIWKCVEGLRQEGYKIDSVPNRGYRLVASADRLTYTEVEPYLDTSFIGREWDYLEEVDSTNSYGKKIARESGEGKVLVAEEQTAGRGRMGRNWQSEKGEGIYFSIILKPEISPDRLSRITLIGASAVVLALEEMGIDGYIKWPNDIIVKNKKVCGILTEMAGELNSIDYLVMGIGVNVNNEPGSFDREVAKKATSLRIEKGRPINRQELLARILNNFENLYLSYIEEDNFQATLEIARSKSILIGREVRFIEGGQEENILVEGISDDGELIVRDRHGKRRRVYSGEVSIRGKEAYI